MLIVFCSPLNGFHFQWACLFFALKILQKQNHTVWNFFLRKTALNAHEMLLGITKPHLMDIFYPPPPVIFYTKVRVLVFYEVCAMRAILCQSHVYFGKKIPVDVKSCWSRPILQPVKKIRATPLTRVDLHALIQVMHFEMKHFWTVKKSIHINYRKNIELTCLSLASSTCMVALRLRMTASRSCTIRNQIHGIVTSELRVTSESAYNTYFFWNKNKNKNKNA